MLFETMQKDLARVYLKNNGISDAFVWDDGPDGWSVYIGSSADACGWAEIKGLRKREAVAKCKILNQIIKSLSV